MQKQQQIIDQGNKEAQETAKIIEAKQPKSNQNIIDAILKLEGENQMNDQEKIYKQMDLE